MLFIGDPYGSKRTWRIIISIEIIVSANILREKKQKKKEENRGKTIFGRSHGDGNNQIRTQYNFFLLILLLEIA